VTSTWTTFPTDPGGDPSPGRKVERPDWDDSEGLEGLEGLEGRTRWNSVVVSVVNSRHPWRRSMRRRGVNFLRRSSLGGEWDQLGPCGLFPQLFDIFLGVTGVKILIQNSFCEGKSMLKLSSRALSTHVHPRSTIILCCLLVERTIARFSV